MVEPVRVPIRDPLARAPECETCGQYAFPSARELHESMPHHQAHALLARRAAEGWVPVVGPAIVALRARGAEIAWEGHNPRRSGAREHTRIAFATLEMARSTLGELQAIRASRRRYSQILGTAETYLVYAVATAELARASGMPWRLAWAQVSEKFIATWFNGVWW